MKFLLIQDNSQLLSYFREAVRSRVEEIIAVPVQWRSLVSGKVDLELLGQQHRPSYFVFAVNLRQDATAVEIKEYQRCFEWVERTARKYLIPVIFISSAQVFDDSKRVFHEADEPKAKTPVAGAYIDCEKLLSKKSRRHIILRSSWLYSAKDDFVSHAIECAANGILISFNSEGKSCPTSLEDFSQVLLAILLQLELGAETWGIYHYVSSDTALGFQFLEAIVAQASQFDGDIDVGGLRFDHNNEDTPPFYFEPVILSCQRLLSDFGIHQRSWRQMLAVAVRRYFDE